MRFLVRARAALLALLPALAGCDLLEFSPNDHRVPEAYTNLTEKNLARLRAQPRPPGDTLKFVFTGDSQRFYDEAEALVEALNRRNDVSFMLVAGDISDFGLAREMRWIAEKLNRLRFPYLTVVGNHDLVGNGREAYQHMFGPLDYSFVYAGTKFVLVDTNGREYNFNGQVPNIGWVRSQLMAPEGSRRQVVVCHVPPSNDDFDPALRQPYLQALRDAPSLAFAMNGHNHVQRIGQPHNDGITHINSDAFSERHYMLVSLWGNREFRVQRVAF